MARIIIPPMPSNFVGMDTWGQQAAVRAWGTGCVALINGCDLIEDLVIPSLPAASCFIDTWAYQAASTEWKKVMEAAAKKLK
jgi:hypothetical protein